MDMTINGSGYVGLTTGACFAEVGHTVTCVDNNPDKIKTLEEGDIPIYEPGLAEIVQKNVAAGRLKFTTDTKQGVASGDIIFIAVPTPPQPDGSVDLRFIEKVAREIAEVITEYKVIVDKSTVPVKTGEKVAEGIGMDLIEALVAEVAEVSAFDPKGAEKATEWPISSKIKIADCALAACDGAEALVIATDWPEFAALDFEEVKKRMVTPLIFDGRNLLDPATMRGRGFEYHGIGRGTT
jgi:UDP-glucose 6-dehydrogenase